MRDIRTVGIISKPNVPQAAQLVPEVLKWLSSRGVAVRCDDATARYAGNAESVPRERVANGADLVVVLGGDGTLLSAARALGGRDIPLFPVNLGGLGFLTAIPRDEVCPELDRFFRGEHRIGRRSMLECRVMREGEQASHYTALNDIVVTKSSIARMPLRRGDTVVAVRSPHVLQLVRPPRSMFFDVLRQKLKWGER